MEWFQANAPIRQKTYIAFGTLIAIGGVSGLLTMILPVMFGLPVLAAALALAIWQAHRFREAICTPYIATVVRMEALAAGDLHSPINYTDYQDCVGRMTRAMFTFRDTAIERQRIAAEQGEVVALVSSHLRSLAEGDLTQPITRELPAEYAELRTNYNGAVEGLHTLIGEVAESTIKIGSGANEIAAASSDLAHRTENNAASLERTSAAVTQMDSRLRQTAEAAAHTVERADQAIATVVDGRVIADEAVVAMGRVADSAKGIDSVIEGLDKISFQTRVLAMNAAVEAGRAGEAGRGFAVVADLVSALAMRAEEEAKRARDQLTVTQNDIASAVGSVRRVDNALATISDNVNTVHELLGRIASDNQAQSAAIGEINQAVSAMDTATQQNAAMVEQTSAAARELGGEVSALTANTERFRIGPPRIGAATPVRSTAPRPAPARAATPARKPAGAPTAAQTLDQKLSGTQVKPLPGAAVPALIRPDLGNEEDWQSF